MTNGAIDQLLTSLTVTDRRPQRRPKESGKVGRIALQMRCRHRLRGAHKLEGVVQFVQFLLAWLSADLRASLVRAVRPFVMSADRSVGPDRPLRPAASPETADLVTIHTSRLISFHQYSSKRAIALSYGNE